MSTSDDAGVSHDKQTAGSCRCCSSSDIVTCVQDGHERIVRKLLKQGALPDALNRQGRTAAELAEANGHFRVIATLEASRAQVGASPISYPSTVMLRWLCIFYPDRSARRIHLCMAWPVKDSGT